MRKSKKIICAALSASALSLLAVPGFAAGSSSGGGDIMPFIAIGIVAVAVIAVIAICVGAKKKKSAAASAAAASAVKPEEPKTPAEEPAPEEETIAEEIKEEPAEIEPETVCVESDEIPEPEVHYEAPVKLESVEVVPEEKSEVIEIPTIEVEQDGFTPEPMTEIKEAINVESAPEAEEKAEEPVSEEVAPADETIETASANEDTTAEKTESDLEPGQFRDAETGFIYTYSESGVPIPPEGAVIRYKWSFLGRLIQADNNVKYRYMMIRRLLLSYKKVRSNVSWNFDSYFLGRKPIAKIKVRGQHLVVYFNLDPAEMAGTKYVGEDASKMSRYKAVPFAYRINGERKLQYAMELVKKIMEDAPSAEPQFIERGQEKYAIPYEELGDLFNKGYVKIGGFLAVTRDAQQIADDDDEDGPVNDVSETEEEEAVAVEDNVAPIEKEEFNYSPSKSGN